MFLPRHVETNTFEIIQSEIASRKSYLLNAPQSSGQEFPSKSHQRMIKQTRANAKSVEFQRQEICKHVSPATGNRGALISALIGSASDAKRISPFFRSLSSAAKSSKANKQRKTGKDVFDAQLHGNSATLSVRRSPKPKLHESAVAKPARASIGLRHGRLVFVTVVASVTWPDERRFPAVRGALQRRRRPVLASSAVEEILGRWNSGEQRRAEKRTVLRTLRNSFLVRNRLRLLFQSVRGQHNGTWPQWKIARAGLVGGLSLCSAHQHYGILYERVKTAAHFIGYTVEHVGKVASPVAQPPQKFCGGGRQIVWL